MVSGKSLVARGTPRNEGIRRPDTVRVVHLARQAPELREQNRVRRPLYQPFGSARAVHGLWCWLHRLCASLGFEAHLTRITSELYAQVKLALL